ncbi:hypothetical protein M5D96_004935, partial [Drosophila gunungcola]
APAEYEYDIFTQITRHSTIGRTKALGPRPPIRYMAKSKSDRGGVPTPPLPSNQQDNEGGSSGGQKSPRTARSFIMTPLRGARTSSSFIMQAHGSATGRMSDEMLISRQGSPQSTTTKLILMKSHKCLSHMQNGHGAGSGKCHD